MYPRILGMSSYDLMMTIGFLMAGLLIVLANRRHPAYRLPVMEIIFLSVFILVGVFFGARVLFLLTNLAKVHDFKNFWDILLNGGLVFYGGVIGGILMGYLYCKLYGLDPARYADLIFCFLPIGHMIGRIGCFLSGCCYGRQTASWLGIVFPAGSDAAFALNGGRAVKVYPVQLFEAIFLLLLSVFLIVRFFRKKEHKPFQLTGLYLVGYGIWRFAIEFLRGDEIRGVYLLSTSQWISIVMLALGILLILGIPQKWSFLQQTPALVKPRAKQAKE